MSPHPDSVSPSSSPEVDTGGSLRHQPSEAALEKVLEIGFIGGTGPQGKGLAYQFARAGHRVLIGSRSLERAQATAAEIRARLPAATAVGATNETAAAKTQVIVVAIPYAGHAETVRSLRPVLAGKIVVSCVNPLGFDRTGPFGLAVHDGSAAEEAGRLAPESRVVGAFHHVSAVNLWRDGDTLSHEDILVCGDDHEAKAVVLQLARSVGHRGVDVGALRMARILEPLTAVLVSVNKRYQTRSGVALVGLPTS